MITKEQAHYNRVTGKVYEKLRNGDSITDEELEIAINKFEIFADLLSKLGAHFYFVRSAVIKDLHSLKSFKVSRERKF